MRPLPQPAFGQPLPPKLARRAQANQQVCHMRTEICCRLTVVTRQWVDHPALNSAFGNS